MANKLFHGDPGEGLPSPWDVIQVNSFSSSAQPHPMIPNLARGHASVQGGQSIPSGGGSSSVSGGGASGSVSLGRVTSANGLITALANANFSTVSTATYTVGATDDALWFDATSAGITVTLPLAATSSTQRFLFLGKKDSSAHTVTLTASGSDTINGASTLVFSGQYDGAILVSDGVSGWVVYARFWGKQNANVVFAGPSSGGAALPAFRALVNGDLPTVDVPHGGTGDVTLTAHGLLVGEGTSAVAVTSAGTSGQLLIGQGASADPTFNTVSGDTTISNTGAVTLANTAVTPASYTNTNLTVDSKGRITAASNGSSGSLPTSYIDGCNLTYDTTTSIKVNTGTVGLANGSSWTVASIISNSPTLAASTMYYVYLTSASTVSVTSTAPSSNYAGTAWNDGTTSHRYVGAFLTDASVHIINFYRLGNEMRYGAFVTSAPLIMLSGGTASTSTSVACSSVIPPTSRFGIFRIQVNQITYGLTNGVGFGSSDTVTPTTTTGYFLLGDANNTGLPAFLTTEVTFRLNSSQAFLYCGASGSNTPTDVNCLGYKEDL